jgi:ribosomal protein S18 acetylase RimI-like enzyme
VILRGTIDDAEEILALQKLAFGKQAELYDDWTLPPIVETLADLRGKFADHIFLKAMAGPKIVGSVRARAEGAVCHVGRLVVDPAHQRKGLASALMKAIEAEFPTVERFELFTGTKSEGSILLYERLGYVPMGTEAVSPKVSHVILKKETRGDNKR